jgi:general secretion pathway protein C
MRIALDPRTRRLLARMPRTNALTLIELVLLSLLALQCARLVWTLLTPVGPIGDWRAPGTLRPAAGATELSGGFDPFFRLTGQSGPVVVTSLNLTLYGVRQDQASGRGSAIVGTPDGKQMSVGVGEEIVPGVTLTAVDFDSVTISRGGVPEQLFMDQSPAPQVVGPTAPVPAPTAPPIVMMPERPGSPSSAASPNPASDIRFQPRMNGSRLSGIVVQPQGSGEGFRALGLAPGDVIISVGGQRITSPDDARSIAERIGGQRQVLLQVERDGRVMTLRGGNR